MERGLAPARQREQGQHAEGVFVACGLWFDLGRSIVGLAWLATRHSSRGYGLRRDKWRTVRSELAANAGLSSCLAHLTLWRVDRAGVPCLLSTLNPLCSPRVQNAADVLMHTCAPRRFE